MQHRLITYPFELVQATNVLDPSRELTGKCWSITCLCTTTKNTSPIIVHKPYQQVLINKHKRGLHKCIGKLWQIMRSRRVYARMGNLPVSLLYHSPNDQNFCCVVQDLLVVKAFHQHCQSLLASNGPAIHTPFKKYSQTEQEAHQQKLKYFPLCKG